MIINVYKHHLTRNPEAKMIHLKKELSEELGIGVGTIYQTVLSAGHIMLVASHELKKPLLPAVDQLGVTTKFSAGVTSRRVFVSG